MILKKDKLDALLDELSKSAVVYVPKEISGVYKFAPYISAPKARFDIVNTVLPPKDLLFPQSQKMYHYGVDTNGDMYVDPIVESEAQVLFGVRPCDMRSIECLDDVFFTKGYVDEFYEAKRQKLLTVAICCMTCGEACFCESMGLDPNEAPGADIVLHESADAYDVAVQTEEGTAALEAWKPFLEQGELEVPEAHCTLSVDAENIKDRIAALADSDELWDGISIKCLNCGTCTYVCPTCYCFDIEQENRCKEGVRFRCWDSCMFSEYTEMAGGHNPRPEKVDRVRNRFMHKLSYFEDRYGKKLCVGCGRCVEKCPVALDITLLIDRVCELTETTEVTAHA